VNTERINMSHNIFATVKNVHFPACPYYGMVSLAGPMLCDCKERRQRRLEVIRTTVLQELRRRIALGEHTGRNHAQPGPSRRLVPKPTQAKVPDNPGTSGVAGRAVTGARKFDQTRNFAQKYVGTLNPTTVDPFWRTPSHAIGLEYSITNRAKDLFQLLTHTSLNMGKFNPDDIRPYLKHITLEEALHAHFLVKPHIVPDYPKSGRPGRPHATQAIFADGINIQKFTDKIIDSFHIYSGNRQVSEEDYQKWETYHKETNPHHPDGLCREQLWWETVETMFDLLSCAVQQKGNIIVAFEEIWNWIYTYNAPLQHGSDFCPNVNPKFKHLNPIGIMVFLARCHKQGFSERHSENARVHKVAFTTNAQRDMRNMWKAHGGQESTFIPAVQHLLMKVTEFYKCDPLVQPLLLAYKEDLAIHVGLVNMELHKMGIPGSHDFDKLTPGSFLNYAFHWGVTGPRVKFAPPTHFLNTRQAPESFGLPKLIAIDPEETEVAARCITKHGTFDVATPSTSREEPKPHFRPTYPDDLSEAEFDQMVIDDLCATPGEHTGLADMTDKLAAGIETTIASSIDRTLAKDTVQESLVEMVRSACKPEFDNLMKIAEELKNESQKTLDTSNATAQKAQDLMDKYDAAFKPLLEKANGTIDVYSNLGSLLTGMAETIKSFLPTPKSGMSFPVFPSDWLSYISLPDIGLILVSYICYEAASSWLVKGTIVLGMLKFLGIMDMMLKPIQQLYNNFKQYFETQDEHTAKDDDEEEGDSWLEWLSKMLVSQSPKKISFMLGVLIIALAGTTVDVPILMGLAKKTMRLLTNTHFIGLGLLGMQRVFTYTQTAFEVAIDYIKTEVIGMKPEHQVNAAAIAKWFTRVAFFKSEQGISMLRTSKAAQEEAKSLRSEGTKFMLALYANKNWAGPEMRHLVYTHYKDTLTIANILFRIQTYTSFRPTMFHMQLVGSAGIGKSTLVRNVVKDVKNEVFVNAPDDNLVYAMTTAQHYDNYTNQLFMVADDIFVYNDPEHMATLITLITNTPVPLPMAHLEDKNTFLTSEWLISTTNTPYPPVDGMYCQEAVHRRRHALVEVKCDPDVINKGTHKFDSAMYAKKYGDIDGGKYLTYEGRCEFPHLRFSFLKPVRDSAQPLEEETKLVESADNYDSAKGIIYCAHMYEGRVIELNTNKNCTCDACPHCIQLNQACRPCRKLHAATMKVLKYEQTAHYSKDDVLPKGMSLPLSNLTYKQMVAKTITRYRELRQEEAHFDEKDKAKAVEVSFADIDVCIEDLFHGDQSAIPDHMNAWHLDSSISLATRPKVAQVAENIRKDPELGAVTDSAWDRVKRNLNKMAEEMCADPLHKPTTSPNDPTPEFSKPSPGQHTGREDEEEEMTYADACDMLEDHYKDKYPVNYQEILYERFAKPLETSPRTKVAMSREQKRELAQRMGIGDPERVVKASTSQDFYVPGPSTYDNQKDFKFFSELEQQKEQHDRLIRQRCPDAYHRHHLPEFYANTPIELGAQGPKLEEASWSSTSIPKEYFPYTQQEARYVERNIPPTNPKSLDVLEPNPNDYDLTDDHQRHLYEMRRRLYQLRRKYHCTVTHHNDPNQHQKPDQLVTKLKIKNMFDEYEEITAMKLSTMYKRQHAFGPETRDNPTGRHSLSLTPANYVPHWLLSKLGFLPSNDVINELYGGQCISPGLAYTKQQQQLSFPVAFLKNIYYMDGQFYFRTDGDAWFNYFASRLAEVSTAQFKDWEKLPEGVRTQIANLQTSSGLKVDDPDTFIMWMDSDDGTIAGQALVTVSSFLAHDLLFQEYCADLLMRFSPLEVQKLCMHARAISKTLPERLAEYDWLKTLMKPVWPYFKKFQSFYHWFWYTFVSGFRWIFSLVFSFIVVKVIKGIASLFTPKEEHTSKVLFKGTANRPTIAVHTSKNFEQLSDSLLDRNITLCKIVDGPQFNAIRSDRYFITCYHTVSEYVRNQTDFVLQYMPTPSSKDWWQVPITWSDISHLENTDFCVIYSPQIPQARNVEHWFLKLEDLDKLQNSEVVHMYYTDPQRPVYVVAKPTQLLSNKAIVENSVVYNYSPMLRLNAPSVKGSSGAPILSANDRLDGARRIIGVQSCNSDKVAFVQVVTQDMLQRAIHQLKHSQPLILDQGPAVAEHTASVAERYLEEPVQVVGSVPKHMRAGSLGVSKIVRTLFYDTLFPEEEITHAPAIISKTDRRVTAEMRSEGFHPLKNSVNKFARDVMTPLPSEKLEKAVEDISTYIRWKIGNPQLRELSLSEVILGHDHPGSGSLEISTSPGLPWVCERYAGKPKGKGAYVQIVTHDDGRPNDYVIREDVLDSYEQYDLAYRHGVIPPNSMYEFPKDELKPIHKLHKTRSVTVMNLENVMLFRKYHLDLTAHMHQAADGTFQSCVGINPEGLSWNVMFQELLQKSEVNCFDLDVSNWDGHMTPQLFYAASDVVNNLYNAPKGSPSYIARRSIVTAAVFGYDQLEDVVFQKMRGMPSGFAGTSIYNTIVHMLVFYVWWLILCEREGKPGLANFNAYLSAVAVRFYGDDVVCSVHSSVSHWFHSASVSDLYSYYGWPTTCASKSGGMVPFVSLYEVQFLKRKFLLEYGKHSFGSVIVHSAIDKSVIKNLLCFMRVNSRTVQLEQLYENINCAMQFCFAYGEQTYTALLKKINEILIGNDHAPFMITYRDMRACMLRERFGININ